jgi:epoxide hydrolase-like predicted phosphatase
MTIRAIVWDLGGVLLRTRDPAPRERLAKRLNMTRQDLEELVFTSESGNRAQLGEIPVEEHWEIFRQRLDLPPGTIREFQKEFWAGDSLDTMLVDNIRSLHKRYRTALLSNAFSDLRKLVTDVWEFSDAFDEMVISAEVGMVKPDPRIYRLVLERLNIAAPEAVFIDDFAHNVDGARAVDMHAIHFINPQQALADLEKLLENDNHERE